MREALDQVKRALGPDAVILSTRSVRPRENGKSSGGRPIVEITASAENASLPPRPLRQGRLVGGDRPQSQSLLPAPRSGAPDPFLGEEVRELSSMVQMLLRSGGLVPAGGRSRELMQRYRQLIAGGVDEGLAGKLINQAAERLTGDDPPTAGGGNGNGKVGGNGNGTAGDSTKIEAGKAETIESLLARMLRDEIRTAGPVACRPGKRLIAAFVGPTGVGKTTTIAKIASELAIGQKRRTALVTFDTHRIAAVEQLRIYARIIGIPCLVVSSRKALQSALKRLGRAEAILIDTAGRSQRNPGRMQALADVLSVDEEIETHLVLSATTKERDLLDVWRRFTVVAPDRLIFTKIDESASFGGLYNMAHYSGRPLSYLTTGQRVPEDIEVADKERVAGLVLRSPLH